MFKDLFELVDFYITSHDGQLRPLLKDPRYNIKLNCTDCGAYYAVTL